MSTKADTPEKGIDTRTNQRRPAAMARYLFLGTDQNGFHHVANQHEQRVYRVDPRTGEPERVTDLTEHPNPECRNITTYLHFIAESVGWDDRRVLFSESIWGGFGK